MKYLDFEKHIKKEIEGSTENVQIESLLASLNLGKEPKRKPFALWMIIPFLLLAGSAATWHLIGTNDNNSVDAQLKNNSTSELVTNPHKEDKEIKSYYENSTLTPENNNIDKNPQKSNYNKLNHDKSNVLLSGSHEKSILKERDSASGNSSLSSNVVSKQSASTEFYLNRQNSNPSQLNESKKQSDLKSAFVSKKIEAKPIADNSSRNSSEVLSIKSPRSLMMIGELENDLELFEENDVDDNLFKRMRINCPSFDNAGWHMALIPEIGVFRPMKTLGSNGFEGSEAFNKRVESETTLEGIELGLYGMLVRDNLPVYVKAGISYSRIAERMDLKYEYVEMDTTLGIISTTVSGNGDTITHIYGDIVTETTFKGSNRQHHYIHLFDIPISVGYTTYIGGFDVGIEAGVKVNFMTRATGNLLTSQSEYTNLSLNKLFKNRVGVNYFGGLMIGRNFGRYGDIFIAPRFTYFPNEFNNENNTVSQKYLNIGLNAGVVYKIN